MRERKRSGGWTFFVASRYFNSKRKDKNLASSVLSVIGIALGTMTLITVIGVMNGFQIGFIEDILEISSFHVRVETVEGGSYDGLLEQIGSVKGVRSVIPVQESQTIVKTDFSGFEPCLVRGVPADFGAYDQGLVRQLNILHPLEGGLQPGEVLIGVELANHLGAAQGDEISVLSLAGESFRTIKPEQKALQVAGVFKSGYYEYDRGLAFVNLETVSDISSDSDKPVLGVKLDNRYRDKSAILKIESVLDKGSYSSIVTWREYNSSFFGALRMEKIAMMVLIGLIFLVVGGNIYQSLKRTVMEKTEEISLMKSLGADGKSIRRIFIYDGFLIGLIGGFSGMTAGLVVSFNINTVFSIFETVTNAVLMVAMQVASPLLAAGMEEVAVFSPRYYYMSEVPVKLPLQEVVFVFLFAFLSATVAAYFASKRITQIKPSEVLRYE